jgi:hypothetical protein
LGDVHDPKMISTVSRVKLARHSEAAVSPRARQWRASS